MVHGVWGAKGGYIWEGSCAVLMDFLLWREKIQIASAVSCFMKVLECGTPLENNLPDVLPKLVCKRCG